MKNTSLQRGFTLVEMIISIAIFIVVAVVAIGALLSVINANKKSQSLKTSINNLNFTLESMSREMRVGGDFYCSPASNSFPNTLSASTACTTALPNTWTIAFNSSKTAAIQSGGTCHLVFAYSFENGTLSKAEQTDCGVSATFAPVISPDVIFKGTVRVVAGSGIQSYAQFHFAGYSGIKEKTKTYFDLQTTVSQRISD